MLTLTRKPEETIIIGEGSEQIEITVKEIRRNQVRLGISAPDNMRIYRKELLVRDAARENMESDAEGGADARE
ncbi:MAG: carbon storage regulator [Bradymonadia bacterium]